jgi:hypothetical protein
VPYLAEQVLDLLGRDDASVRLDTWLRERRSQGMSKDELYAGCMRAVELLRAQDRERDEDVVLDAMDALVGWCAPRYWID